MSNETLGDRVVAARNRLGMSQAELARRVGITPQAMQWIESGKTRRPRFLMEIAATLDVASEWLLRGVPGPGEMPIRKSLDEYRRQDVSRSEELWLASIEKALPPKLAPVDVYDPERMPVHVATQYPHAEVVVRAGGVLEQLAWNDFFSDGQPLPDTHASAFEKVPLLALEHADPDDYIARPPSLHDRKNAYGLYMLPGAGMAPRLVGIETLNVDPDAEPIEGGLVILWHRYNVLMPAELRRMTESVAHCTVYPAGVPVPVDIPRARVRDIHVVVGLEYRIPPLSRYLSDAPTPSIDQLQRELSDLRARLAEYEAKGLDLNFDLNRLFLAHPELRNRLSKKLDDIIK